MNYILSFVLPATIVFISILIFFSKKDLFSAFITGCNIGLSTTVNILPALIVLVVCVKMFSSSGALSALCDLFAPLLNIIGIRKEILPVFFMRTISGSGATATIKELFDTLGPDSIQGKSASVLMGSSDTIIYTLSVYFSHIGVKKSFYALPLAISVLLFCTWFSCLLSNLL